MKKSVLFFALLAFVSLSASQCGSNEDVKPEENGKVCDTSDPVNELTWLKNLITKQTDKTAPGVPSPFKLVAYTYKSKTVIEDESFLYSSPYIHVFYCDGTQALTLGEYEDFINKRTKIRQLYEFNP